MGQRESKTRMEQQTEAPVEKDTLKQRAETPR